MRIEIRDDAAVVSEIKGSNPFREGMWEDDPHTEFSGDGVEVEVRGVPRSRWATVDLRDVGLTVFCYAGDAGRWKDAKWCREHAWRVVGKLAPRKLRQVVEHLIRLGRITGVRSAAHVLQTHGDRLRRHVTEAAAR